MGQGSGRHGLGELVRTGLRHPREGARQFLSLPIDERHTGELVAAAILLGSVTEYLFALALVTVSRTSDQPPGQIERMLEAVLASGPVTLAVAGALAFGLRWGLVVLAGRLFSGKGSLGEAARLLAWYDILWTVLFLAILLVVVVLPPIGVLLLMFAGFWSVWMMVEFVSALHGWENRMAVFFGLMTGYLFLQILLGLLPI